MRVESLEGRIALSLPAHTDLPEDAASSLAESDAPAAAVTGRHLFYNDSALDGNTPGIDPADSSAIATDKSAYLPGGGVITPSSMTSYAKGLNGLFVDVANPAGTLALGDFTLRVSELETSANNTPGSWAAAPSPAGFTVLSDTPSPGTDRVEFIWAAGDIVNRYLEVTVEGNDAAGGFNTNTGLAESDVFYFGSIVGDTFTSTPATVFLTSATDETEIQGQVISAAPITSVHDMDRNGVHLASDQIVARGHTLTAVNRIDISDSSPVVLVHADGSKSYYPPEADTDEARGTAFRAAATAAIADEVVIVGPGTYNIDAQIAAIELAPGVEIRGAGMDLTIIQSAISGSHEVNDRCLLEVADNVTLRDFTFHATLSNGNYQFPIGRMRAGAFTDVVLERVKIYAPATSDAFYTWTTAGSSLYLYDCDFRSGYDTVAFLSSNPGDYLYAENCYFESTGENWIGHPNGLANNLVNKAGNFYLVNCQLRTRNNAVGSLQTLGVWNYQANAVTTVIDCQFDVQAADGAVFDLARPWGGSGGFVISGGQGSGENGAITTTGGNVTHAAPPSATAQPAAPASSDIASAVARWDDSRDAPFDARPWMERTAVAPPPRGAAEGRFWRQLGEATDPRGRVMLDVAEDAAESLVLDEGLDVLLDERG